MSDITSKQMLVVAAQGLKHSIGATKLHIASLTSTQPLSSALEIRFAQIKGKYTEFAKNYDAELDEFMGSVYQSIHDEQLRFAQEQLQQQQRERAEIVSNTSPTLEIEDNLAGIDYSPASSVTNEIIAPSLPNQAPVVKVDKPRPKSTKVAKKKAKSTTPKPKKTKAKKNNKNSFKNIQKMQRTKNQRQTTKRIRKTAVVNQPKPEPKSIIVRNQQAQTKAEEAKTEEHYKYNAKKVNWQYNGQHRTTTVVYVGNLPNHIKVAAVQYFVIKKAKVTLRHIEETLIKQGARGKFALVRFRSDVLMPTIEAFISSVNAENDALYQKRKSESEMDKNSKKTKESWQKRVFLKFNRTFKYYPSEESMYCDPSRRNALFLRNFDILDRNCHKNLTRALMKFGDLAKDIVIRVDGFGDPYCIVTFKYIDDAVYCCNSEVYFGGRMLEMRYSKY